MAVRYNSAYFQPMATTIIGRENEQAILDSVLSGHAPGPIPCAVFVCGPPATAKTSVITHFLTHTLPPSPGTSPQHHRCSLTRVACGRAIIDCIGAYTARIAFESVLNQLSGVLPSPTNAYLGFCRCDTLAEFIPRIIQVITQSYSRATPVYIVLDHADRLRSLHAIIIPAFLRLGELVSLRQWHSIIT